MRISSSVMSSRSRHVSRASCRAKNSGWGRESRFVLTHIKCSVRSIKVWGARHCERQLATFLYKGLHVPLTVTSRRFVDSFDGSYRILGRRRRERKREAE
ncbi:hypothetical protein EVAR_45560_1 [Eumeta japonica]|uniref:Uncharacterized protein n=1 Tax=Eumeta variegata TaxID=151549 RepID=A0A4C1X8K9_EUMVA|nr:hypothetical protein EVAR_45560_1 [Eumeta japonica]